MTTDTKHPCDITGCCIFSPLGVRVFEKEM